MRLDHAVILVPQLPRAVEAFQDAGFAVTPGGVHGGGATHNALIPFADGSYLELLAFTRKLAMPTLRTMGLLGLAAYARGSGGPIEQRFRERAARSSGLIDFALHSTSLEADLARARREGVRIVGPVAGGRSREGAPSISWALGVPEAIELPFFCSDVTDRELRVPAGAATEHPNGVIGTGWIAVAVERLESSSARFRALLGVDPQPTAVEGLGQSRARGFSLDRGRVIVASADEASHQLRRYLRERGEGPYEVGLLVGSTEQAGPREVHGARFRFIPERAVSSG